VTRQRAGRQRNFFFISDRDKSHFLLQSVHTGSGSQPVYHLKDYGRKAVWAWSRTFLVCTEFKNELVYTSTPPKYLRNEYPWLLFLATRGEQYSWPVYSCGINISWAYIFHILIHELHVCHAIIYAMNLYRHGRLRPWKTGMWSRRYFMPGAQRQKLQGIILHLVDHLIPDAL